MLAVSMAFAAVWGVVQLTVLGSLTRTVRLRVLLLGVGVECLVKILPLLALARWSRAGRQWGLTDWTLAGPRSERADDPDTGDRRPQLAARVLRTARRPVQAARTSPAPLLAAPAVTERVGVERLEGVPQRRWRGFEPPAWHHNDDVDDLVVTRSLTVRDADLQERFSRSSGPGGQGVNTADSRVELSFDVARAPGIGPHLRARLLDRLQARLVDGVLTIAASEHRTQLANRKAARDRLAESLREAATPPPPPRRATRPSRGAKERRLAEKKRRGATKQGRAGNWD